MYLNGDNVECRVNAINPMLLCFLVGSREVD